MKFFCIYLALGLLSFLNQYIGFYQFEENFSHYNFKYFLILKSLLLLSFWDSTCMYFGQFDTVPQIIDILVIVFLLF